MDRYADGGPVLSVVLSDAILDRVRDASVPMAPLSTLERAVGAIEPARQRGRMHHEDHQPRQTPRHQVSVGTPLAEGV